MLAEAVRLAAETAGAAEAYLCMDAGDPAPVAAVEAVARGLEASGPAITVAPMVSTLVLEDDSALLRVLEGRQAIPHVSVPPSARPTLWGRPAVVLDIEEMVRSIQNTTPGGGPNTKAARMVTVWAQGEPVVVEVPETATVGEVLGDLAPVKVGVRVARFGGTVGRFLAGSGLDTPLGPAASWCPPVLEVVPAGTCGVAAVRDALRELSTMSCGACVVCREGTRQLTDMLAEVADSRAAAEVPGLMRELGTALEDGSVCGLGVAAADVLRTGLEAFAADFSAHLDGRPCPEVGADA